MRKGKGLIPSYIIRSCASMTAASYSLSQKAMSTLTSDHANIVHEPSTNESKQSLPSRCKYSVYAVVPITDGYPKQVPYSRVTKPRLTITIVPSMTNSKLRKSLLRRRVDVPGYAGLSTHLRSNIVAFKRAMKFDMSILSCGFLLGTLRTRVA